MDFKTKSLVAGGCNQRPLIYSEGGHPVIDMVEFTGPIPRFWAKERIEEVKLEYEISDDLTKYTCYVDDEVAQVQSDEKFSPEPVEQPILQSEFHGLQR